MAEERKPAKVAALGEIISIKPLLKADYVDENNNSKLRHDCRVVTIDTLDGNPNIEVFITDDQWRSYGLEPIMFEGNVVNVTLEVCIKGVTTYVDENGVIMFHKDNYNAFVNAKNVGELSLIRVFTSLDIPPAIVDDFRKTIIEKRNVKLVDMARNAVNIVKEDIAVNDDAVEDEDYDDSDDSKVNRLYMRILNEITDKDMFFLLAGPCVIEGEKMALEIAGHISELTDKLGIPYVFKGSFKKANRSRLDSFTGIGDEKALKILAKIREEFRIPVVTDIHSPEDAVMAAEYVDVLQIPAFLCRQTDLLVAAAHTGKMINVKKGQFLSPDAMHFAIEKIRESGNENVMATERGTTFGYQDLVVDFRGIKIMQQTCHCPVVVDVTHSLQQPNQAGGVTGGQPELIETIAKAGIAVGADGLFIETHPDPSVAKSDGANMLRLDLLEGLLNKLVRIRQAIRV